MASPCSHSALRDTLAAFCCRPATAVAKPLAAGNINDTYLVDDNGRRFVLQRLHSGVFPDPERIVSNFAMVSGHLITTARERGEIYLCAQPVRTLAGELCHRDGQGDIWRAQSWIEHIPTSRITFHQHNARQLGRVLARFHLLTADLAVEALADPLPGFHLTPRYLGQFDQAVACRQGSMTPATQEAVECVERFRLIADSLESRVRDGRLQRRVIHGDPKLDNVIFTGEGAASGFFDLDTTGPGLLQYDIGDCLRSCCNRAGESATHWDRVKFDLGICEAVLGGYFETGGEALSLEDRHAIYDGVLVITFELGLRFLADHLRGDLYFKVQAAGDNLRRAQGQFRLVESIVAHEREIRQLVERLGRMISPAAGS